MNVHAEERSASSPAWEGAAPQVTVGIPTHGRAEMLPPLVRALEAQTLAADAFEVVVVDDASADATWEVLAHLATTTRLRLRAVRTDANRGPAEARNLAARIGRGAVLAFTDDDCRPSDRWLAELIRPFATGADLVQGRTLPDPETARTGVWDRSIQITAPTPLFESCNIAYRRSIFDDAGGFPADRPAAAGTRPHFGEDAVLGWRATAGGARRAFAPDAVVHHRVHPASFGEWLRETSRLSLFPELVRRSPGMERALWGRTFLTPTTAAFDLAAAAGVAAAALRSPWPLLAALPWAASRSRAAIRLRRRNPLVRLAQLALGDAVGLVSLARGSLRARRVVL
jgi:glycosyltransferase involved in cell wall biosynthesis